MISSKEIQHLYNLLNDCACCNDTPLVTSFVCCTDRFCYFGVSMSIIEKCFWICFVSKMFFMSLKGCHIIRMDCCEGYVCMLRPPVSAHTNILEMLSVNILNKKLKVRRIQGFTYSLKPVCYLLFAFDWMSN